MSTIYTNSVCPRCKSLIKSAAASGLPFEVVNLEEHPEKADEFRSRGLRQLPIVEKQGKYHTGAPGALEFMKS